MECRRLAGKGDSDILYFEKSLDLSKLDKYTLKICALYINFTSKEKNYY